MPKPLSQKYNSSSQVASLLNPVRGLRDEQRRSGHVPVDHARRNLLSLKETERRVQEELNTRPAPKVPFKLKQFQHVPSRVKAASTSPRSPASPNQQEQNQKTHKFLRKGERCKTISPKDNLRRTKDSRIEESSLSDARLGSARSGGKRKDPVPKADEVNKLAPRSNKNFIQENAKQVLERDAENKAKQMARKEKELMERSKYKSFGQVPEYLVKRQAELLEEKARKITQNDPECLPGMVLVPEGERLKTLDSLKRNAEETRNELRKFPLTIKSMAQRERKKELEDRLQEQENAIEIFSKTKVYVYE